MSEYLQVNRLTFHSLQDCPDKSRKSCREVKQDCPTSLSGFYDIEIDGQIVKAFCDLEVEGGKGYYIRIFIAVILILLTLSAGCKDS